MKVVNVSGFSPQRNAYFDACWNIQRFSVLRENRRFRGCEGSCREATATYPMDTSGRPVTFKNIAIAKQGSPDGRVLVFKFTRVQLQLLFSKTKAQQTCRVEWNVYFALTKATSFCQVSLHREQNAKVTVKCSTFFVFVALLFTIFFGELNTHKLSKENGM